jgi:hypothetical protein
VGPKLAFGLGAASIYFWPQFRVNTLLLNSASDEIFGRDSGALHQVAFQLGC